MRPTKYKNLYRSNGVFQYLYVEDNLKIEARDCNDLKFKLAVKGIKLQEKTSTEKDNIVVKKINRENKSIKKQIRPTTQKSRQTKTDFGKKPLKKNVDYIESKEEVNFGKIEYIDLKGGVYRTWGPDNSKRARKLREDIIK